MSARFLAFDLGAESGRAALGELRAGVLSLREVSRFPNVPTRDNGVLQWNVTQLWVEVRQILERLEISDRPDVIGVDAWGCDFGLLDELGRLIEEPYHYRDSRVNGVMDRVFNHISREEIYETTGIQFLSFNTIYQLYAMHESARAQLERACTFLTIPDLFNYWLTGRQCAEFTIATTTQLVDARTQEWATRLFLALDLPTALTAPLVAPGSTVGAVLPSVSARLKGTPVIAPGCHDTASAVSSVRATGSTAFLSSGTWSLLGTELPAPILTAKSRDLNFTNEGGVEGSTRFLKNIAGLWILQACRRSWAAAGHRYGYDELVAAAGEETSRFSVLFDPDDHEFRQPDDMVASIAAYCRRTGQPDPAGTAGYARAILESLALKYRMVLEALQELTGTTFTEIRVIGGGARNRLLNQFTADATGCTVVAGPAEATALGNIAMQMVGTGAVSSLDEARGIIERSFPVERFEPLEPEHWEVPFQRFQEYVELSNA